MKNIYLSFFIFTAAIACNLDLDNTDALFTSMPVSHTNVNFVNEVEETKEWNSMQYPYFYDGAGVAIGEVNNDSLPDLFFSANKLPNKLYLNRGNRQF